MKPKPQGLMAGRGPLPGQSGGPSALFPKGYEGGLFGLGRPVQDWYSAASRNARTAYGEVMRRTGDASKANDAWVATLAGNPRDSPIVNGFGTADLGVLGSLFGTIKAYHGSPHTFDKFSMSKIGTGEGAQAYGHGLYFAESPGVAQAYRDTLSAPVTKRIDSQSMDPQDIAIAFYRRLGKRGAALHAEKMAANDPANKDAYLKAAEIIRSGDPYAGASPGNLYEVELAPNKEDLLDWDKPLSEQGEAVRNALSKAEYSGEPHQFPDDRRGEALYTDAGLIAMRMPGYEGMNMHQAAAAYLRKLGIPGIKYLDQGSRSGGEGTHNFVMFNDADVAIKARR